MKNAPAWVIALLLGAGLLQGCGGASQAKSAPSRTYYRGSGGERQVQATLASMPGVAREESGVADADEAGGAEAPADMPETASPPPPPPAMPAPKLAETKATDPAKPEPAKEQGPREGKRAPIVVYTAEFGLQVIDVKASLDEAERMAREVGGLVSKRTDRMIVLRVPAARFHESVGRIEKLGDVLRRDVSAQDVTEEFLDLEIRLRNARAVRERLVVLLARATTVKDSIELERELSRVNGEIDQIEGRLKYLSDRAAFSTITLQVEPRRVAAPPPAVRLPFPWLRRNGLAQLLSL